MSRKLEIEVSEKFYSKMKEGSKKESISIEEYVVNKLQEKERDKYQLETMKKTITYDLQKILFKLKTADRAFVDQETENIEINSLTSYPKTLSKTLANVVNIYKQQKTFHEENFYIISIEDEVVGYIGLDYHEEPLPYGVYGFIYVFNLKQSYQKKNILTKIMKVLRNELKEKKVYNLDIASNSSNLTPSELEQLGFLTFSQAHRGEARIREMERTDSPLKVNEIKPIKMEELNTTSIDDYIPAARIFPLNYLDNTVLKNKVNVQVEKIIYKGLEVEIFLIKRCIKLEDKRFYYYVILMDPISIYDKEILKEVYRSLFMGLKEEEKCINLTIEFPAEIKTYLEEYLEYINLEKFCWYRKILS